MTGVRAGLLLIVIGAALAAPGLVAVGTLIGVAWMLGRLWSRYGLRQLTYERHLTARRAAVGEEIGLELVVRNRKLLPVPWLQVDDLVSQGAVVAGRPLLPADRPGFQVVRTTWTLGWFQRVTRRFQISADERGVYDFLAVQMQVADVFSQSSAFEERALPERYRVVPRSVPARATESLSQVPGSARSRLGLFEDPTLFAGVRPYQAGDAIRRIHWKATGRLGKPVSRRFDPGHERELVIALDAQTVPGPFWVMQYEEELIEGLCIAALSLARSLIGAGVACGLAGQWLLDTPRTHGLPGSQRNSHAGRAHRRRAGGPEPMAGPALLAPDRRSRTPPAGDDACRCRHRARPAARFCPPCNGSGRRVARLACWHSGRTAPAPPNTHGRLAFRRSVVQLTPDWRTADALTLVG